MEANEEKIENSTDQNDNKSNKTNELSKNESEPSSESTFTYNKSNVMDYETNQKGVLDLIDELYKKYGIKNEDAEKKEEKNEEILKSEEKVLDVFNLFCKDSEAKNLKEQLIYHYQVENEYMNVLDEYTKLMDERNNFFDDHIFEEKCVKLLKEKYNLTDFDAFPLFKKTRSVYGETYYFYFLDDISNYIPINFEKEKFRFVTLIERDINRNISGVYFNFPDYDCNIEKKCKEKKTNKDNAQEKENNNKMTKDKKDGFTSITISLNEDEISKQSTDLKDYLSKLENEIMNSKKDSQKLEKKKSLSKFKDMIILEIEKRNQEFDGFFLIERKTCIQNTIIPEGSFFLVEVKNNNNDNKIKKNIIKKINLLLSLGIKIDKLFFVGILKEIKEKGKNKRVDVKIDDKSSALSKEETNRGNMQKYYKGHILIISSNDLLKKGEKLYKKKENEMSILLQLIKNMNKNIESMNEKIESMNKKIGNIDKRLIAVEKKLETKSDL